MFTDPAAADLAGEYTASITWGDGTVSAGTVIGSYGLFQVTGSHTYVTSGYPQAEVDVFWADPQQEAKGRTQAEVKPDDPVEMLGSRIIPSNSRYTYYVNVPAGKLTKF